MNKPNEANQYLQSELPDSPFSPYPSELKYPEFNYVEVIYKKERIWYRNIIKTIPEALQQVPNKPVDYYFSYFRIELQRLEKNYTKIRIFNMQCKHIKENGEQCQCHALKEDDYCFRHTKKIPTEVKRQWSVKGGYNRKPRMEKPIELLELNKAGDIVVLLGTCINMLLHGQIDGKLANSIGFLCNPLLRALEISELSKRIEKLEEKTQQRSLENDTYL